MNKYILLTAFVLMSTPAFALEDNTKMQMVFDKVERLEQDLVLLQRRVYQEPSTSGIPLMGTTPQSSSYSGNGGIDELYSKLMAQEAALMDLTAQIEKINFDMTQLSDRINKINADVDMRFNTLQKENEPKQKIPVPPKKQKTAQEDYDAAYDLLKRGKYEQAEAQFQEFIKKYPDNKLTGNANYWLGETYYTRGQMEQAAGIFATGFTTYKDNTKAPDNLFKLGLTMKQLNKKDEACTAFTTLAEAFPKADKSLKERAQAEAEKLSCPK